MSPFKINVSWDMVDAIVVAQLRDTYESFIEDLAKIDAGRDPAIFYWGEPEKDKAELQKHIDALGLLLKWYSTPEQLKEMGLES